jgi:tight adherence protein C
LIGTVLVIAVYRLGLVKSGVEALLRFPGGVGEIFLPVMYAAPWLAAFLLVAAPWVVVRAARRERVVQIEQDLPLFLELLATLAEAGIGFDAALERVLDAQRQDRPLTEEFRTFQREVLAGVVRVRALRRVADRADVLSLTILISALVQAEQVGSGIAEVLRRQADDLRSRRRERAMSLANALPVKLLFPLVICFLPGLFVATLGPTFYQFFQFADSVIQNRGLR